MVDVIRLPITDAGRACLRHAIQTGIYLAGAAYGQHGHLVDWDQIAAQADADWQSYCQFLREQNQ